LVALACAGNAWPEPPARTTDAVAVGKAYRSATRVEGLKGVSDVGRVAPGLYRGDAPSAEGLDSLKALGVRTVVNL
jgi:tyrosine-protein phosphatase SIW14